MIHCSYQTSASIRPRPGRDFPRSLRRLAAGLRSFPRPQPPLPLRSAPPPLGDPSDLPQPLAASRALRGHVGVGGGPAGRGETADGSRSPLAFLELFPETLPLTHAPSLKEHRRQKAAPGPGDAGHTALLPLLHRESL